MIGPNDLLIAAIALASGLVLITHWRSSGRSNVSLSSG